MPLSEFLVADHMQREPASIRQDAAITEAIKAIRNAEYGCLIVVDGDPLSDLGLLQDQGAHIPVIMRGGHIFKSELD